MNLALHDDPPENQPCRSCGAVDGFIERAKGPHTGLYCRSCDGWIRWIPKSAGKPDELQKPAHIWGEPPAKKKPPKFTPRQLAHPLTIEEQIAALAHDVSILAQIVVGARHVD